MPCDSVRTSPEQTLAQRAAEIRKAGLAIDALVAGGRVKVKVGPQGAITFVGIPDDTRAGITDACVYRRIMTSGTTGAKLAIAKAERLAGRAVDKKVVGIGVHSHDGGRSWHPRDR